MKYVYVVISGERGEGGHVLYVCSEYTAAYCVALGECTRHPDTVWSCNWWVDRHGNHIVTWDNWKEGCDWVAIERWEVK